jgi:hypothetical protein
MAKACHSAPGNHSGVALHSPRAALGRFDLLGDFVDVSVE